MERVGELVKAAAGLVADFVYPPACLACGAEVARHGALCAACFLALEPITAPFCPVLGTPFVADPGPGIVSAEALSETRPYQRARAAVSYGPVARRLVSRLKYSDRPELAHFLARQMARAGAEYWPHGPVLVPVPMPFFRHLARRFNQAEEIARALGRLTGAPVLTGLVRRSGETRRQVGLSGAERRRNLAGAFTVSPHALSLLAGRPVVLVDDVITTGATMRAVAAALAKAGITGIDVLAFARVVSAPEVPIYRAPPDEADDETR